MKVLIADDERKVGLLIQNLIEWERLDLQLIGIVQDGDTAYETICREKPDIVITDIRMPHLSGLEMIQKVVEDGIKIHFIVISGYKYFEYAQQAIKYGVEDYLLKPIEERELNQILQNICQKEQSREQEIKQVGVMEKKIQDSKYVLHREFLNCITSKSGINMIEANKSFGLNFERGLFRVICCKIDRDISSELNGEQINLILKKIGDMIEDAFKQKVTDIAITKQKNASVMVILNYDENMRESVRCAIDGVFQNAGDYLSGFEHYEISMGVSYECVEFARLNHAVETAREVIDYRILRGTGRKLEVEVVRTDGVVCAQEIAEQSRESLKNAVEIARYDVICRLTSKNFFEARNKGAFASEYYALGEILLGQYLEENSFLNDKEREEAIKKWSEYIHNCKTVLQLEKFVSNAITEHLEECVKKNQEKERKPVLNAVEYIRKNYNMKICLEDIAAESGFNSNYFSELFKKETGKNFTNYLTEVRMEEAKKLLRDTELTVYKVADKVGYKDAKFFSQQFVKQVGVKPIEYRKLYY